MCFLAIYYRAVPGATLFVAANREEAFARESRRPVVHPGRPRVLCGSDAVAGGTWLGLNEHGLLVGVTNRGYQPPSAESRSRGLLCREMLACGSAEEAAELARHELSMGRYAGANFVALDALSGWLIAWVGRLQIHSLEPGLHLLTNGDLNDPGDPRQNFARRLFAERAPHSVEEFIASAQFVCSRAGTDVSDETIIVRGSSRGTVSSTLVALTDDLSGSQYWFAEGPPDRVAYENLTPLVGELFGEA